MSTPSLFHVRIDLVPVLGVGVHEMVVLLDEVKIVLISPQFLKS